ncbi:Alpha/Beta hydrolase protein [Aspergillus pseudocaelatus]|uniref:Carboxylic ester hydrolase n=1 Tax=Aspergillus pseudocaelatus TaxID=1825620 RepID=A0ABQ6W2D2_9EURO|nr:Alpha/Beta hydrolase protein [Aspergillus pseudocaelatus]
MIVDLSISALTFFLVTYWHICAASSLPVVDLGYELHQAFSLNETTGLYNFSNIRYAAPPLGSLRFRAPLPPKVNRAGVQTGAVGRICPQATPIWSRYIMSQFLTSYVTNATFSASLDVSSYPVPLVQDPRISEDCLFLDVVVPQKVFDRVQGRTPVPKESLAPVIVYFYGGGYVLGDKSGVDPSGLIQRSQQQGKDGIIYVTLNYRLGAFGWLAGHTVSRKGTPNAALHDQRLGLTWVTQNIHLFGGDADRVTVMGVSAGSGSILHRLTAYKGLQGPSLFQQAILQSPAWEPNYDTDKQEWTFRQYLKLLNVSTIEEARQLSSEKLIAANAHQVSIFLYGTFTYGPVVDGVFVSDLPGKLLLGGEFDHSVKILNGHTLNEALMYTPPFSFQDGGLLVLMDEHFLDLSEEMKETIVNVLYPPILDGKYGYRGWVERVSSALSDICFLCNSYYLNHAYRNSTYTYVFSIPPAMHWMDHPYSFYIKGAKPLVENPLFQVTNETVAFILQDYITSFVQTGRPASSLAPPLEIYGPESRVVSIGSDNITRMRDPACNARCVYWQTAFTYSRDDL